MSKQNPRPTAGAKRLDRLIEATSLANLTGAERLDRLIEATRPSGLKVEEQPDAQGPPDPSSPSPSIPKLETHPDQPRPQFQRVAGSAFNLVTQFGLTTMISGLTAIVITRLLGPSSFGQYAAALATWSVLGASADFGFTLMLSRDMARNDAARHRAMLRSAYEVATAWSLVLALIMVGLASTAGFASVRGVELLVLTPSMIANGLNPARAFFTVTYQTRRLLGIDVGFAMVVALVMVLLAASGMGAIAVTIAVSSGSLIKNLVVTYVAARMIEPTDTGRYGRRELVRRAAPLGLLAIMTKVYFMIDLVLLGWLIAGPALGDYAAASKLLTVLASVAGIVMSGALPALATHVNQREELERLVARVWHWLIIGAVPMFVAVALFAPLIVRLTIGAKYGGTVPLLRILCLAGIVSIVTNVAGVLMIALHKNRALLTQSAVAIVVNVAGNLILVPRVGVSAAAWMTLATEMLVCSAGLFSLRREVSFRGCARVSARPAGAVVGATAVALALGRWPLPAMLVGSAAFLLLSTGLKAWPSEFRVARLRSAD